MRGRPSSDPAWAAGGEARRRRRAGAGRSRAAIAERIGLVAVVLCLSGVGGTAGARQTATDDVASPAATATCSAAGLSPVVPTSPLLPKAVARTRSDLARAAVACNWTALAAVIKRSGGVIRYTFGAGNTPIAYWRNAERSRVAVRPMRALRLLLGVPWAKQVPKKGLVVYMWPAAFAHEHPTTTQLRQIARTGLYTMATLQAWVRSGLNYLGYRIIITSKGKWTTFVEGD